MASTLRIGAHELVGLHEHGIAAEDGRVHIPLHARWGVPRATGGIHDVVVHEGEVVEELDAERFVEHRSAVTAE
jgi:hypothetical protein